MKKKLEFKWQISELSIQWRIAGAENYRSLNKILYMQAKAILLVYDITNRRSFNEIEADWIKRILDCCDQDYVKVILVGNKTDLNDKR